MNPKQMLSNDPGVQECDATMLNRDPVAGYIIFFGMRTAFSDTKPNPVPSIVKSYIPNKKIG